MHATHQRPHGRLRKAAARRVVVVAVALQPVAGNVMACLWDRDGWIVNPAIGARMYMFGVLLAEKIKAWALHHAKRIAMMMNGPGGLAVSVARRRASVHCNCH